jgi:hypothetical protein
VTDSGRVLTDQALVASPSSQQAVSTEGFDPSRAEEDAILVLAACIDAEKHLANARWLISRAINDDGGREAEFMGDAARHVAEARRLINASPELPAAPNGGDAQGQSHD